ncbi:hypothetical protein [Vibrio harveyi]|uniref:hypothetical protein n=1 Tax=Vibrio harveyi TaxID=669 RepID=UPI0040401B9A
MKVSELQEVFLTELGSLLPEWKYVNSPRTFKLKSGNFNWHLHISCINRASGFDATADVAVEFLDKKKKLIIVGAELGNIEGAGQRRFPVISYDDAVGSARRLKLCFEAVGLPFLNLYSDPKVVLLSLKKGGKDAMSISPLPNLHDQQIEILSQYIEECTQQSV